MNLDPRSIPYRILDNGLRIGFFTVLAIFFSGGEGGGSSGLASTLTLIALILAVFIVREFAYVRRYEYRVTADTFDITSGVISRREREIPFERIQNVDIAQNVVQRGIGIAEVRLETAGGGSTEARLRYVSRPEATRLQNLVSDRKRGDDTAAAAESPTNVLFHLENRELAILGLTSANLRFIGLIAVVLSAVGSPVAARQISPRVGLLLLLGPAFALAGLLALWIASGVQAVLRYYDFRLLRQDEELRYERGLLQRYNGTIPLSKVQTIMIRENFIARAVGYASLVIETAGYAPGQGGSSVESAVPIAKRSRVIELAKTIEDVDEVSFERPPKRARQRYVARYSIVVGILTAIAWVVHDQTGAFDLWFLVAALWILVPPAAHLKWTHLGYSLEPNHVVTRKGFWTRRTSVVPYYRVQTISDSQTIFQRRRDLATLVVDTATSGGFWGGDAIALDIDVETARALRETVHDRFHESVARRERLATDENAVDAAVPSSSQLDDTSPAEFPG
jgi:putative membrane protein